MKFSSRLQSAMDFSFIASKSGCHAALSVANCSGPEAGADLQSIGVAPPPELAAGLLLSAELSAAEEDPALELASLDDAADELSARRTLGGRGRGRAAGT